MQIPCRLKRGFQRSPLLKTRLTQNLAGCFFNPVQSSPSICSSKRMWVFCILRAILRFPILLSNTWRNSRGMTLDSEGMRPGHPLLVVSVCTKEALPEVLHSPRVQVGTQHYYLFPLTLQGAEATVSPA